MIHIGSVERKMYSLREEHPLVIPQLDSKNIGANNFYNILKQISGFGLNHIAIGSSLVSPELLRQFLDIAVKDFGFSVVTYPTNSSVCYLKGTRNKTAIYWMSVLNAENPFYLKDVLIMNSSSFMHNEFEPIPTAYVFDDRGELKTSNWLSRAFPVPRDKPDVSLAVALAAQYLGMRIYIMAGGSGCKLIPPVSHLDLLAKKTNLFLIPTSGIVTKSNAETMFKHHADAIHIGNLLENAKGMKILGKMVDVSKKYPGKHFL